METFQSYQYLRNPEIGLKSCAICRTGKMDLLGTQLFPCSTILFRVFHKSVQYFLPWVSFSYSQAINRSLLSLGVRRTGIGHIKWLDLQTEVREPLFHSNLHLFEHGELSKEILLENWFFVASEWLGNIPIFLSVSIQETSFLPSLGFRNMR